MSVIVYGIRNCDTLKKSLQWLDAHGVSHTFHDYRKQGLSGELLDEMIAALGWDALVNRRGTTWRGLDEQTPFILEAVVIEPDALRERLNDYDVVLTF